MTAADVEEWDSLMQITVLLAMEKQFNIRFRVGEAEIAENVGHSPS